MLTPEQAADLVTHFGSQRAAARATGVPQSMLSYWLNPERTRELNAARHRRYLENLPGLAYNRRLLRNRRWRALHRMAKREQRRASSGPL